MTSGLDSAPGVLVVAAVVAIVGAVQSIINNRAARKRQQDDWDRADVIDKRKEKAAEEVATRADERAADVAATAKIASNTAQKTLEIATTTHSLVNSKMTEVKEGTLIALELALDVIGGNIPPPEKVRALRQQIADLRAELVGRAAIQEDINRGI